MLIVYMSCLNRIDQHGVSLRNWFADWPEENLAQIYSGGEVGAERFCGHNFRLKVGERRCGNLFFWLKESSLGKSSQPIILENGIREKLSQVGPLTSWKHRVGRLLMNSGVWELVFPPVLSPELIQWVQDFSPDIIYAQGYSLTFAWLPIMLQSCFGLPLCFQTGDDWPRFLYRNSMVSWVMRPIVDKAVRRLLCASSVRFSNGERMAREYLYRYGVAFEPVMMCDCLQRFREASPRRLVDEGCISIVYSGGLGHNRWMSLIDLAEATKELSDIGPRIKITAFASSVPPEGAEALVSFPNMQVCPPPTHEDVPGILKGADMLFLPETFQPAEAERIRLSISTKAHLYMMSERPVLVYGSPVAGVVDYASRSGWGYVADRRDKLLLSAAIRRLITDADLQRGLIARSLEICAQNHDASVVRERFRMALLEAAQRGVECS